MVDASNGKGDIYTIQGEKDSAAFYTSNSYKVAKEVNYKDGMCDALNIDSKNWHVLFKVDSIDHIDGLFQAQTAFAYANSVNNKFGLVDAYNNYTLYFLKIKDYPEARKYANFAFEIAGQIGYTAGEADALNNLGEICYKLEYNKDSALYYFQKSLLRSKMGYFKECGNYKVGQVNSYNHIGDIYKKMGKKTLSGEYYTQAYIISQEIMFDEGLEKANKSLKLKKNGMPSLNSTGKGGRVKSKGNRGNE